MLLWFAFFSHYQLNIWMQLHLSSLQKHLKPFIIQFNRNLMTSVAKLLEEPSILLCPVPPLSVTLVHFYSHTLPLFNYTWCCVTMRIPFLMQRGTPHLDIIIGLPQMVAWSRSAPFQSPA